MTGILNILAGSISSAIKDGYFNLTTLLLPGNGTNGAQNNTFLDSSSNNFTITRNGGNPGMTQGTFSPFTAPAGYWSVFFNNANSDAIQLGTTVFNNMPSAFTFEAWVFPTRWGPSTTEYYNTCIFGKGATYMNFGLNSTGKLQLYHYDGTQRSNASTGTVPLNTWTHVAAVISAGVITFYINGTASGTATWYGLDTANANGTDDAFGYTADGNAGANRYFGGYISNARYTKAAVYTSNFTPSATPLTNSAASTNSTFLIAQANRFIDASASPITFSAYGGTPSVQAFSPFAPTAAYSAATNGGSGYFDGTGDYLTVPQNTALNIGTGAFTVEAWVYPTAWPTTQDTSIMSLGEGATAATYRTGWGLLLQTDGTPRWYRYDGSTETAYASSIKLTLNQWNHVVVVRNGSSNLSIYVNGARGYNNASANVSYNNINTNPLYISRFVSGTGPTTAHLTGYNSSQRLVVGSNVYDPTQTSITVPTAPPTAITNTQLLLNYTNAGVTDATAKNVLETVGNAQISTTQSKFGGSSMSFNGTNSYLKLSDNAIYSLSGGNYTIEFWLYLNSVTGIQVLVERFTAPSGPGYTLYMNGTAVELYGSALVFSSGTLSTGQWYHIAVSRSGSTTYLFINGTQSTSTTNNIGDSAQPVYVGARTGTGSYLNGYIDDLRITKGYARYTANFTAPTAAFPVQ